MTMRTSRRSRWPAAGLEIVASCFIAGLPGLAKAGVPDPPPITEETTQQLFLAVSVNGVRKAGLHPFAQAADGLRADAVLLRQLGLRWPGSEQAEGEIALAGLPGLEVNYDSAGLRLSLVAPVDLLDRPVLRLSSGLASATPADPSTRVAGAVLNYDLYSESRAGGVSASAFGDLRFFGEGAAVWSQSAVAHAASRTGAPALVRLDTQWQVDDAESMTVLRLGDGLTGGQGWTRTKRIGGFHYGRDFGLQPYRTTTPLAAFVGEAVLPSTLELYVNGLRQSTQQVQPGRFQLDAVPPGTGAAVANLLITDINGQQRNVHFDLYGAPTLLQAGLSDWSVDVGFLRKDYGLRSFAYDHRPLASGSYRWGWSNTLTLESHAEATTDLFEAGVGSVWKLGDRAGVLTTSLAASRGDGTSGNQRAVGYQWAGIDFGFAVNSARSSAGYRDAASRLEPALSRGSDSAFVNFGTPVGQWSLGVVRQLLAQSKPAHYLNLGWAADLGRGATLSLNVQRVNDEKKSYSTSLTFSMPLDSRVMTSASVQQRRGSTQLSASASQSPRDETGWSWWAQTATTNGRDPSAQFQVGRLTEAGQWWVGTTANGGSAGTSVYASRNGALAWLAGDLHALRHVEDAIAVVTTDGVPDVPVRLENRLLGRTDARGQIFVPQLNAYQRNQISMDTLDLPMDIVADKVQADVVPERRRASRVRLPLRRIVPVHVSLRNQQGQPLDPGGVVELRMGDSKTGASTRVGYDGLVYLEDPPPGAALFVRGEAGRCTARLPDPLPPAGGEPTPLECKP
ncbi:fimbria/pilus outer membrane usher protein [Ramlibacter humi]|uniref:Fimbrial biogenesis outer membrane usher protein n=1 Tax=Ramlibacter humi TaxID=2530451 RepID=A0A4Z0CAZ8_9BURK|nr:fimbria/pilus outer membrane usher protein [Ramlibacter humi]TFZ08773.1 fimbrial biogenesis outer membrane usher protein [Ramlibacter humi]